MVVQREVILDVAVADVDEVKVWSSIKLCRMQETQKLIFCCLGIFVCYFYYGILQEKITRVPYGEEKETFKFEQTLVLIQCCVNAVFAYVSIKLAYEKEEKDTTPTLLYVWCSLSYMGAMLSSNMALQYVNYPTQVLGKSCKPIPVMLLGVLLARKRYPLVKYLSVLLIVIGVALFLFKDKKSSQQDSSSFGFGEVLLLVSLMLDGLTGASQDKMRLEYKTQSHPMMLAVNVWSIVVLAFGVLLTGELFEFVGFFSRYPYVLWNMMLFSLTSALGQNFIFVTVANFGPLTCSVVTTTRKFFTILFSVLFFGNSINTRQWVAVFLVFAGLGIDAGYGKKRSN